MRRSAFSGHAPFFGPRPLDTHIGARRNFVAKETDANFVLTLRIHRFGDNYGACVEKAEDVLPIKIYYVIATITLIQLRARSYVVKGDKSHCDRDHHASLNRP